MTTQQSLVVDVVGPKLKSHVVDLEAGRDGAERRIEHVVALLLVDHGSRGPSGETRSIRIVVEVMGIRSVVVATGGTLKEVDDATRNRHR